MPNPAGADAEGEWFEIGNGGTEPVALAGWSIGTATGKQYVLREGTLAPGGALVIKRDVSKLALTNTSGELILRAPNGEVIQRSYFVGAAPEGKSVAATDGASGFVEPSPGVFAQRSLATALIRDAHPIGVPLGRGYGATDAVVAGCIVAALFAACAWFVYDAVYPRDVREQFTGKNENPRQTTRTAGP